MVVLSHSMSAIDCNPPAQDKEAVTISKKKLRKLNRLTVAQLKQLVDRPDVVEMHDVTAHDPKLLIHLKVSCNGVVLLCTRYVHSRDTLMGDLSTYC